MNRVTLDGEYGVYKEHRNFTFDRCSSQKLSNDEYLKLRYVTNLTSSFNVTDEIFDIDNLNVDLRIGKFQQSICSQLGVNKDGG